MPLKGTQNITNLFLYNKFVNDTDDAPSSDIGDIETLRYTIDEVCDLISKKCARNFGTQEYMEWIPAKGESFLVLNNYPITKIRLVSTGQIDLMTVKTTGFQIATVSSNNSSLTLDSINTAGSEITTVLNYSDYANVNSISTAIDTISGWDAEVLGSQGDALTQLIRPVSSDYAADNQIVYLQGPYLGGKARISHDSDSIIELSGTSYGEIFVWYVAGYVLPVANDQGSELTVEGNVPKGLTMIANKIILDSLQQKDEDTNMESENFVGEHSYKRTVILSSIDKFWPDLNQWSRKSV